VGKQISGVTPSVDLDHLGGVIITEVSGRAESSDSAAISGRKGLPHVLDALGGDRLRIGRVIEDFH
jgi:hypothetical protein